MSVHSPQGAPPPPPPGPPPVKKGLSPLAWVGIGCGGLLVLGLIAMVAGGIFVKNKVQKFADNPEMAVAEAIVAANPDVEKVSSDPEAKTITVRDKKTGEETTFNLADIKEGRWEVKTKDGTATMGAEGITVTDAKGQVSTFGVTAGSGDRPAWLPAYPGGTDAGTFATNTPDGKTGGYTVSTGDTVDQVVAFYESKLKEAGFKVTKTMTTSADSASGATVAATTDDEKRTAGVMVGTSDGQTTAFVTYNEKP